MPISDFLAWLRNSTKSGSDLALWISLLALLALALWAARRRFHAGSRAQAAEDRIEGIGAGGDSIFAPLPDLEPAVEIQDPAPLQPLLLEAPPSSAPAPAPDLPAPQAAAAPLTPLIESAPVTLELPLVHPPALETAGDDSEPIAVRDLVLTWYEARGYRFRLVPERYRPIEFEMRHQTRPGRAYVFAAVQERITEATASKLVHLARDAGKTRLVVAAEHGMDPLVAKEMRRRGIRTFDAASIRAQIARADLATAARIVAVARSRFEARKAAEATRGGQSEPEPAY